MDNKWLRENLNALEEVRDTVVATNKEWAERLGIPQSVATTCVKPSGTVSQLVNSASGMHRRFGSYYLRRVRADAKDPLTQMLIDAGVPYEQDLFKPQQMVFTFPQKAPKSASLREHATAIDDLEAWKQLQEYWCEHKPSVTINVKEDEWFKVGAWVYENFDTLSGVSFLPYDGGVYPQMPYEEVTKDEYDEWVKKMPKTIDWSRLPEFEKEDMTTGTQEFACAGGVCEIVDIGVMSNG